MSASAEAAPAAPTGPVQLWRHPAFCSTLAICALVTATAPLWWGPFSAALFDLEYALAGLLPAETIARAAWFLLPVTGFAAGLLASISPCILPLVPLNVAYIGAADASGTRAVALSARFVLGAALALSLLGLVGDLAGWVLIEQRGPMLLGVGVALVYLGLASLELAPLPFSGRAPGATRRVGPLGAGAAFSVVTTPCASPLLAAVLAAAGAQSIPGLAVASMVSFALGYTLLVFLAGACGGGAVARLRQLSFDAPRAAAGALLLVVGAGFFLAGVAWF